MFDAEGAAFNHMYTTKDGSKRMYGHLTDPMMTKMPADYKNREKQRKRNESDKRRKIAALVLEAKQRAMERKEQIEEENPKVVAEKIREI